MKNSVELYYRALIVEVPQQLKVAPPHDPVTPLLGIHPRESKAEPQRCICMPVLIAALFTVAKMGKQPQRPWVEEYVKCPLLNACIWWSLSNEALEVAVCGGYTCFLSTSSPSGAVVWQEHRHRLRSQCLVWIWWQKDTCRIWGEGLRPSPRPSPWSSPARTEGHLPTRPWR